MFYVGQKVVAVKTHSQGLFKKDDVFTVLETNNLSCCGIAVVNVGINKRTNHVICSKCGCTSKNTSPHCLFAEICFAPIEEYSDSMSIAMQLIQELDQVDKAKNPVKEGAKV